MEDDLQDQLTPRQRGLLLEIARLERLRQAITIARIGTELNMPRQNVRIYVQIGRAHV